MIDNLKEILDNLDIVEHCLNTPMQKNDMCGDCKYKTEKMLNQSVRYHNCKVHKLQSKYNSSGLYAYSIDNLINEEKILFNRQTKKYMSLEILKKLKNIKSL